MAQRSAELKHFARTMRNQPTQTESRIWCTVRGRRLGGYKFRRQFPVGPYIADFICLELRLIIELDGAYHAEHDMHDYDERRSDYLIHHGFRVVRIENKLLAKDPRMVEDVLRHAIQSCESAR